MKEVGLFFVKLLITIVRVVVMGIAGIIGGPGGAYAVKRWFEDQFGDLMWD